MFTMTFAILGVWGGINQSQARIAKDIMNSKKCYIIYSLHIIDIQIHLCIYLSSNEDEYQDELKLLGLEDSGSEVNVAAYSEKQKFR